MGKYNFEATVESLALGYRKRQALGILPSMSTSATLQSSYD